MPPKRKVVDVAGSSSAAAAGLQYFLTCKEGSSDKFYEISINGTKVISRYGRTGTQGASVSKELSNAEEVKTYIDFLLVEKTKKGYVEQDVPRSSEEPAQQPDDEKPETKPAKKVKKAAGAEDVVKEVNYLECTEGGSRKFYELTHFQATRSLSAMVRSVPVGLFPRRTLGATWTPRPSSLRRLSGKRKRKVTSTCHAPRI